MKDSTNVIVFPALGHDITKIRPEFRKEAGCVLDNGGEIILLDMEEISKGNVVASGILNYEMAMDYDNCTIDKNDIQNYLAATGLKSVAYDRRCFFRLPAPVSPDFYQLMRWKLGIQLVEAVMNTADYDAVLRYASIDHNFQMLMGSKSGIPNQRQWWVGGKMVMAVPAGYPPFGEPEIVSDYFTKRLSEAVNSFGRQLMVIDLVRYKNGKWSVDAIKEGQTTSLPQNRDLSPLFSALVNYHP